MSDERPKPEHWDATPKEVIAAEKRLTEHGAVKVVSMWWSDPYVMGVLADGKTVVLGKPHGWWTPYPPKDKLAEAVKAGKALCRECLTMGGEERAKLATDVAYCCGLREWIPVCAEHKEEMGDGGPEDCP